MEKLIKENLIFILLPILVIVAGIYYAYTFTMEALDTNNAVIDKQQEVETKKQKVQQLMREKQTVKEQPKEKKVAKSAVSARPTIKKEEKSTNKKSSNVNKPKAKAPSKASSGMVSVRRTRR